MSVNTRLSKMYPFHPDEIVMWEEAPRVDAAVARLFKRTTLPLEEPLQGQL